MKQIIEVSDIESIFPEYQNTPIGRLLEYHNLHRQFESYSRAELLIAMCMDNRKSLQIPENFAYIIRSGGANLKYSEFKVSYAIAIGGVTHIALISHNDCGMVKLQQRKESFINGLVTGAGWNKSDAEEHFNKNAPLFEIVNEIDFVVSEAKRLRSIYPKLTIAPMNYNVDNGLLRLIKEDSI